MIDSIVPLPFPACLPQNAVHDFHMASGDKSGYAYGHFAASGRILNYNLGDET